MATLFWLSAALLAYTYALYPLLVYVRARLMPRSPRQLDIASEVSLVIVAHNEATGIREKLQNVHALDYPPERLQVIVASDGSDDGTNEIVAEFPEVTLLALPRTGKIPALNAAAAIATGEILMFSDANSMWAPDAVRNLVRWFIDPSVGGVAGKQSYVKVRVGSSTSAGERAYWGFEQWLKVQESKAGNVTSATGAIYAIRRCLFRPVPCGVTDDAAVSYTVIASGARMLYDDAAVAYERVAPSQAAEFNRKLRVCLRGLHALKSFPQLFNPRRFGFYSVQLVSHKLLRRLTIWPLLGLLISSLWLASVHWVYGAAAAAQALFYASAVAALLLPREIKLERVSKLFTFPFYFCLGNIAFAVAQLRFAAGQRVDRWDVTRS
jgi:cellulose synthase/poly-beta-1,6-N-acetylglucosamine synthase-like glycosyltransferase